MNKLMVWFQHQVGFANGTVIFVEDTAKTDAASNSRVTMGEWLVWGKNSDPNVNQDTSEKL
jgi:hypothetical protein